MRREGASLQEIGDEYGLSRERVRQLVGPSQLKKTCEGCGSEFTARTNQRFCQECRCPTCGKLLTHQRLCDRIRKNVRPIYCSNDCDPEYVRSGTGTFRSAGVKGIYARFYKETGRRINPLFYVIDQNTKKFMPFDSLEEAQAYRASDAWRKKRKKVAAVVTLGSRRVTS